MTHYASNNSENLESSSNRWKTAAELRATIREVLYGQCDLPDKWLEAAAAEAVQAEHDSRMNEVDGLVRGALEHAQSASLRHRSHEIVENILGDRHRAERLRVFLAIAEDNFRRWSEGESVQTDADRDSPVDRETGIAGIDDTQVTPSLSGNVSRPTAAGVRRVAILDQAGYQTYLLARFAGLTVFEIAQLQGKPAPQVESELRMVENEASIDT